MGKEGKEESLCIFMCIDNLALLVYTSWCFVDVAGRREMMDEVEECGVRGVVEEGEEEKIHVRIIIY